jgi:hypothetical protein
MTGCRVAQASFLKSCLRISPVCFMQQRRHRARGFSDASRCAKGLQTMAVYSLTGSASSHFRLIKIPGAHAMQGLCLRRRPVMSQLTAAILQALVAPPVSVLQPHD